MPDETRIGICRRIVRDHRAEEVDEMLLDVQTAHVLTLIWDGLSPESRGQFESLPLERLAAWAWRQVV